MNEQINPQGAFVPAKCPNCGAEFPVNPSQECTVCQFCHQPVITAHAIQNYQANHVNDRSGIVTAPSVPQPEPPKKKHTLLWVPGWLICFPIPLTILMLRNQKIEKKIRWGIIAAGWIVYLLFVLIPRSGDRSTPIETPTQETEIVTTAPEEKQAETTKATTKPAETIITTETTPEETKPQETTTPQPTAAEIQQMIKDGDYSLVTPDFKSLMDSYEAFYDDYIAFMKKYNSGEGDMMAMLNDYMTMASKLEEWSAKIDAIDENTLSPADDAYYLLVTLRIEQKMLSIL